MRELTIGLANVDDAGWVPFLGLTIGGERQYATTLIYSDHSAEQVAATWSSGSAQVATIDGNGKARGVDNGIVTFTAEAHGLTATRQVRVVPSYTGAWKGAYVVRKCRASGAFDPKFWCGDRMFDPGDPLAINLVLALYDDHFVGDNQVWVDGEAFLGTLRHVIEPDTIGGSGDTHLRGYASIDANGATLSAVLDPFPVNASSGVMAGRFTYTVQSPGLEGSVIVEAELQSVRKTSPDAVPSIDAGAPVPIGDLPQLIRQH